MRGEGSRGQEREEERGSQRGEGKGNSVNAYNTLLILLCFQKREKERDRGEERGEIKERVERRERREGRGDWSVAHPVFRLFSASSTPLWLYLPMYWCMSG